MIPNKSNFKFQELTPITGVKPYVLRFWETEFSEINPIISDSGQKLYAKRDIETIFRIKKLLFEDKKSIAEARALLTHSDDLKNSHDLQSQRIDLVPVRDEITSALELIAQIKIKQNWK